MYGVRLSAGAVAFSLAILSCESAVERTVVPLGTPIEYAFATDWEDTLVQEGVRVVETRHGYRITVEALYIGVGALELVPCNTGASLEASVMWLFQPSVARADHGWISDSTRLEPSLAENLLSDSVVLGPVEASGSAYCEAFWTLTPIAARAADGFELVRSSVHVSGWIQGPDDEEPVRFVEELRVGRGELVPISTDWDTESGVMQITRYPARAFDDIQFEGVVLSDALFEFGIALLEQSEARFVEN